MSLSSAIQVGRSALNISQLGIQLAGNNLANAATPGYSRQIAYLTPLSSNSGDPRFNAGRGVWVQDIRRQVDTALQARLWTGVSQQASAEQQYTILSQVEATLGELSGKGLGDQLGTFFKTWSERANQTKSSAIVVQQGVQLAGYMQQMRGDLLKMRDQIDAQVGAAVERANQLLASVAELNRQVSAAEVAGGSANALRDQRDQAITELASLMDVTAVEQPGGGIDLLVGSTPILLGTESRGLELKRESVVSNGVAGIKATVTVKADGSELTVGGGQIGGLLSTRLGAIEEARTKLDQVASQLIFQMNKLHSTGANAAGLTDTTGTLGVRLADRTLAFNSASSQTFTGLPFAASNGGFMVSVKDKATGAVTQVRINVDLDGITSTGAPGTNDDTTPEQVRAALDAVGGISATWSPEGKLRVTADAGFEFSFEDDTSGVLAVMGVNSYFAGSTAGDIAVRQDLVSDPTKLMVGRVVNGTFVENGNALEFVKLQDTALAGLGGRSIKQSWADTAQSIGLQAAGAETLAGSTSVVRTSLEQQRSSIAGVNVDEESINLLSFQRQYQAAARVIQVADELTQALLAIV
ncbi:MAG: flagellar hook-associated protein FlgK [Planctomycetota bacterium]|nr:flagellar hook-associated protein FlgK [Planctomycetota bacterium]